MSDLYYKLNASSEIGQKIRKLIVRGGEIKKETIDFAKSIGASTEMFCRSSRYIFYTGAVAFYFDEIPDMKIWKKFQNYSGYYSPRLSNKAGKDLQAKLDSIEKIEREVLHEIIGYQNLFYSPGFKVGKERYFGFKVQKDAGFKPSYDFHEITFTEYENLK